MNYQVFNVNELVQFDRRDIREGVVKTLEDRIKDEFNPARPLTVCIHDGKNLVVDGNHRLNALRNLGIEEVPCVVREGDPYVMAIKCNSDEETYAPDDLFDYLKMIEDLAGTQTEIGARIGWSQTQITRHTKIIELVMPEVLDFAKQYQTGRGIKDMPNGIFTFTEGWFRASGCCRSG